MKCTENFVNSKSSISLQDFKAECSLHISYSLDIASADQIFTPSRPLGRDSFVSSVSPPVVPIIFSEEVI